MVLCLIIAGCGGGSSSTTSGGATTSEETEGETANAGSKSSSEYPSLAGTTITYLGFGGITDEAMASAWFKPFEEETGAKIVEESPTNYAKIQAQVESGAVNYDLVDGDAFVMDPKCGEEWEEFKNVPNLKHVAKIYQPKSKCTGPDYVYSYVIGYSEKEFPNGGPETCQDFFNTQKFPGKRQIWGYYYGGPPECAAVAAGANVHNPYPLDTEKVIKEVEGAKGNLSVYETASQAADAMQNNDVSMGIYTTRMLIEGQKLGAEWGIAHGWSSTASGTFGIPKGAPNAAAAEELLNYIYDPVNNKRYFEQLPAYGSPEGFVPPQAKKLSPWLVSGSKQILGAGSLVDWTWWSENDAKFSEEWESAITG
ncbi:MAG: extracellular solute-binding protein [Actinobacteria bacterium]|nr:extracellular solute-binding protein [Actinomycetota bacterium]